MALSITATAVDEVDGSDIPAFQLDIVDLGAAVTYTVQRSDGAFVRGADTVPFISDDFTHYDWEAPLGQSFTWTVRTYDADEVQIATATSNSESWTAAEFDPPQPYFIKLLDAPISIDMTVGDWSENSYEPRILGQYEVLGRENPVVFTSAWGARTGSFSIQSVELPWAYTSNDEIESILKTGEVLLLQNVINSTQIEDMFFIVTALERKQYGSLHAGTLEFTYSVGFQEVDRPPTKELQTGYGRWVDLRDDPAYVTYADILADNASWLEVLQRYSSLF